MAPDNMNVSLPAEIKAWVERQVRAGRYSNASDYVCDLIRKDQDCAGKIAHMQMLVDEARASGLSNSSMDEIRAEARSRAGIED